ncbi:MAG TPA: hypothetical protein DCX25_04330 [Candidatus Pacebacteria bacterium]|nr:hypothetical protein [Candidatus Paceibacterota bacterium]HCR93048.1 hypothetical protein [Candidatus Paceibacterota bacterium]
MSTPIRVTFSMIRNRSMQELQKFYQKPIAKVSTELIITIVAVMFLALAAIGPTLTTMSQLLKDIADRKTTDQALTKKIAALSTTSNEVLALQKDLALLDLALPNTPDIDGLLRRIEKIASEHNVVLSSVQTSSVPRETTPDGQTPEQSAQPGQKPAAKTSSATPAVPQQNAVTAFLLTISVKGSYLDIHDFFQALLSADRYLTVDTLIINQQDQQTARGAAVVQTNPLLQAKATLRAAYYGVAPVAVKK